MTDLEPLEAALADLNGAHRTTGGIYPECVTCRQTWPCLSAEATETLTNALPALIAEVKALREAPANLTWRAIVELAASYGHAGDHTIEPGLARMRLDILCDFIAAAALGASDDPPRDPLSPQWEDCKACGGDHWTKDHPS